MSNKWNDDLRRRMEQYEAPAPDDLFDDIISADPDHPAKPDPYLMNAFLSRHSLLAEQTVMVGDTETDIAFAKNSGVHSVGVGRLAGNREHLLLSGAEITMPDISGIPELLNKW